VDLSPVAGRLAALAEADPEREVCGVVVERASGSLEVVAIPNAAGDVEGPPGGGASKRHAFLLDPAAHLALARRLRREGGRIAALYHSHVDGPASLSRTDRETLAVDGEPVLPGADLVVLGSRRGKITEIQVFRWCGATFLPAGRLPVR